MIPVRYVEVTSSYRDRKKYPITAEYRIDSSNSRAQSNCIDPVCDTSPLLYWNNSFNETIQDNYITLNNLDITYSTTDTTIVEAVTNPDTWRKNNHFYNGTVLSFSALNTYASSGLILYLDARITESYSGTGNIWYDLSGNSNNGIIYNALFLNYQEGFLFNNLTNTVINVPNSTTLNPTNAITIETYIKCGTTNTTGLIQGIISKATEYGLFQNGNIPNSFVGVINNITAMYTQTTNSVLPNKWYHIVITYDSTVGNLITYIDSTPIAVYNLSTPIMYSPNYLIIGGTNRYITDTSPRIFPWTDTNGVFHVLFIEMTGEQPGNSYTMEELCTVITNGMNLYKTDSYVYSVTWDPNTQKVNISLSAIYPFDFQLNFDYTLDGPTIANFIGFDNINYIVKGSITSPNSYFYGDFSGNILFVRIYDRALNPSEVLQNYRNSTTEDVFSTRRRIKNYTYLTTEKAELVLYPPPLPDGLRIIRAVIERPTYNTKIDTVPRFFIPGGFDITNYYVGYYLQNLDVGEARKIVAYDGITHLATLETNTNDDWLTFFNWTWNGGATEASTNIPNEPTMRDKPASWVDYRNRVWLYSGANYSLPGTPARPNDLWRLDENKYWKLVKASTGLEVLPVYGTKGVGDGSTTPGGRYEMATCVDINGNFLLFGGKPGPYGDLWSYNVEYGIWTWLASSQGTGVLPNYGVKGVPTSTNEPGSRYAPVIWMDQRGILWLFGGSGHDDIWKWDGEFWTWMYGSNLINNVPVYSGPNATPGARGLSGNANTNSWYDIGKNILYIYGGYGLDSGSNMGVLDDMWKWDGNTHVWTFLSGSQAVNISPVYGIKNIPDTGNTPGGRVGSACWLDSNNNIWMFGGKDEALLYTIYGYGCLWKYDKITGIWTWVSGINIYTELPNGVYNTDLAHPGIRSSSTFWTDLYGVFYLYGGFGYATTTSGTLTDLWKFIPDSSNFIITREVPINYGRVIDVDNHTLVLQNANYPSNYYINSYVRIIGNKPGPVPGYSINPPPYGETRRVIQFDALTKTALLEEGFSTSPSGLLYELLPFSSDNYQVLVYPYQQEQNTLYDIKLVQLRLPKTELAVANGSTCLDYPYVYVMLQNYKVSTGGANTLICSNNPNARNMTFSVGLSNLYNTTGPYIDITGINIVQRIRINPCYDLLFAVYLPNGDLVEFTTPDTYTPESVNPNLQISAVFEFKKVNELGGGVDGGE